MVKLISAILSLTMLFGSGAAPNSISTVTANVPVTVGAQQAVYEKWTVVQDACSPCRGTGKINTIVKCSWCSGSGQEMYDQGYDGHQCGTCSSTSNHAHFRQCYQCSGSGSTGGITTCTSCGGQGKMPYRKDMYLSEITSDNGSLPNNGKHTDGFWYVFKNLVED